MNSDEIFEIRQQIYVSGITQTTSKNIIVSDDYVVSILCVGHTLIDIYGNDFDQTLYYLNNIGTFSRMPSDILVLVAYDVTVMLYLSEDVRRTFKQKTYNALTNKIRDHSVIIALNTAIYENDICVVTRCLNGNEIILGEPSLVMKWKKIYENHLR